MLRPTQLLVARARPALLRRTRTIRGSWGPGAGRCTAAAGVPTREMCSGDPPAAEETLDQKLPIDMLLEEITARAAGVEGAPPLEEAVQLDDDELLARYPPKFAVVVAMSLFSGAGVPQDEGRAIGLWRRLAEQDLSDEAAYSYAMALRTGRGPLEADPAAAAVLLQRSADRDFGWACHALASQYEFGDGVEQDVDRALELHAKAAGLGIVRSYTLLGDVYFQGRGVEKDTAKAEHFYRQGAEGGDAPAMHNLFSLIMARFEEEEGAQGGHPVEAYQWMKKAADAFFPPAMMNLALASVQRDENIPVPNNPERALTLMQGAAVRGFPPAMLHAAYFFLYGIGAERSARDALYWAEMAEQAGVPGVEEAVAHIREVCASEQ